MIRYYIAGPCTDMPELNYPVFNAEAARLRALGHHVENPAENAAPPCGTWEGYMRMSVKQVADVDAVVMLPGWEQSKGAVIEHRLANDLGLKVIYLVREAVPA